MKKYDINYKDVYDLYYNKGLTYKEIAHTYECSQTLVRKIAKRHGFKSLRGKSKYRKFIIQKSKILLEIKDDIIPKMSKKAIEVILGGLLGDSNIRKRKNKYGFKYNVCFNHCEKQKPYLEWKRNIFLPHEVNNIRVNKRSTTKIHGKNFNVQDLYSFSTKPFDMSKIYDLLIEDGLKVVKMNYLKLLTPLSLAVWYQDDGSYGYNNRTIRIATMGFTRKCNNTIKDYFYNFLKIPCIVEKADCGYGCSICLPQNSTKKFLGLIYPYMCDSMMYKNPIFKNPSETSKA